MMRKALIFNEKVIEIADKEFPVAVPMRWVECEDGVKCGDDYKNDAFTPKKPRAFTNQEQFALQMPSTEARLNALWKWALTGDNTDVQALDSKMTHLKQTYSTQE